MTWDKMNVQVGYTIPNNESVHVLGVEFRFEGAAQVGNQPAYGLGLGIRQVGQARGVATKIDEAISPGMRGPPAGTA